MSESKVENNSAELNQETQTSQQDGGSNPQQQKSTQDQSSQTDLQHEQEIQEESMQNRYLRLQADFDNFRKRMQKDRLEAIQRANEDLILDLLPVLDNFQRAMQSMQQLEISSQDQNSQENGATTQLDTMLQGVEMVYKQMEMLLQQRGLERMQVLNETFDVTQHEAVAQEVCSNVNPGHILEELQAGYKLNGKVLRHAKVKVSQAKEESES